MNQKLRLAKLKFRRFRYLIKWFLQFKTNKIKPYQLKETSHGILQTLCGVSFIIIQKITSKQKREI